MPLHGLKQMEIQLSARQTGKVIYSNNHAYDMNTDTGIQHNKAVIDHPDYQISIFEKWFEGVQVTSISIVTAAPAEFSLKYNDQQISYVFCMEGEVNFHEPHQPVTLFYSPSQQRSSTLCEMTQLDFKVAKNAELVYMQLTPEYHQKITNQECPGRYFCFSREQIPLEVHALLQQMSNYAYTGRAERIYLESKIMSLLLLPAKPKDVQVTGIKEDDVKKILLARKIVEDNLQKPFSLIELSRKAGINDFKLKKGFKALTGFTVFGYLYKLRMEKARFYLQQERRQVNEVSFLVGYKNPQHFIAAFKRHFNLLPGSLNKS
ncbi:AraC family transcriptional regulator [Pedobacter sp. BMA]|uniref:AraC family transcriptional regulator n=1 Tax=Pedobacter sp. BMA TaxID=1663685 RepID=UPI00069D345E|nr:AraC family transcriptional regulator [Pedobacter sp. BMA]